jgi:hypothetical protein
MRSIKKVKAIDLQNFKYIPECAPKIMKYTVHKKSLKITLAWDYWGLGLCPSSSVLKNTIENVCPVIEVCVF